MTQDEIIRMAWEAGVSQNKMVHGVNCWSFFTEELELFFNLAFTAGAAHEREACAKVCEGMNKEWSIPFEAVNKCAEAIRARSDK